MQRAPVLAHAPSQVHPAATLQEEVVAAALAQRNIPPHNPAARTPGEAYRTEDLVPPMLADALEIRKLFPAESKAEYREKLKATGQVCACGGVWVAYRVAVDTQALLYLAYPAAAAALLACA